MGFWLLVPGVGMGGGGAPGFTGIYRPSSAPFATRSDPIAAPPPAISRFQAVPAPSAYYPSNPTLPSQ